MVPDVDVSRVPSGEPVARHFDCRFVVLVDVHTDVDGGHHQTASFAPGVIIPIQLLPALHSDFDTAVAIILSAREEQLIAPLSNITACSETGRDASEHLAWSAPTHTDRY